MKKYIWILALAAFAVSTITNCIAQEARHSINKRPPAAKSNKKKASGKITRKNTTLKIAHQMTRSKKSGSDAATHKVMATVIKVILHIPPFEDVDMTGVVKDDVTFHVTSGTMRVYYKHGDGETLVKDVPAGQQFSVFGDATTRSVPPTPIKIMPGNANAIDNFGATALMHAAIEGDVPRLKALIHAGAHVNATDQEGETALMFAAEHGKAACVKELIAAKASLALRSGPTEYGSGFTAFDVAVANNKAECVRALAAAGWDVNTIGADGYTPLMTAAFEGYGECVKALIAAHANVNASAKNDATALSLMNANPNNLSPELKDAIVALLKQAGAKG